MSNKYPARTNSELGFDTAAGAGIGAALHRLLSRNPDSDPLLTARNFEHHGFSAEDAEKVKADKRTKRNKWTAMAAGVGGLAGLTLPGMHGAADYVNPRGVAPTSSETPKPKPKEDG